MHVVFTRPLVLAANVKLVLNFVFSLSVYTLLQTTRPVVSPQQENSAGVSTVRNPLLRLHSSILFLPETRADNVPKNISFYFSSFLWDRVKKQTLQSKEINHAINQGPPPLSPHHKIKIMRLFNESVPNFPSLKILTLLPTHRRH